MTCDCKHCLSHEAFVIESRKGALMAALLLLGIVAFVLCAARFGGLL